MHYLFISNCSSPNTSLRHQLQPDAAVKARLRSLPEAGDQRRSSKFWLNNSSPAAQVWEGNIKAAIAKVEELGQNTSRFGPISKKDMNSLKRSLWPLGVQETFSYLGMEPQLLTTLFGDPNRHSLRVFSRFPSSPPSSWISDRHIDWDLPFVRAFDSIQVLDHL
jgi:hypothetical protein